MQLIEKVGDIFLHVTDNINKVGDIFLHVTDNINKETNKGLKPKFHQRNASYLFRKVPSSQ